MSTNISDADLYAHASRARGQVVVITGAASGIGKQSALAFAKHGAKVVIGDIDTKAASKTIEEIKRSGGEAIFCECNVLIHEDLVALFDRAVSKYGRVDIAIPNAGVTEIGAITDIQKDEKGVPKKPLLKTLEINLISVLHTTQLAIHYIRQNEYSDSLRTLVLIGSMASIMGLPGATLYSAAKHGVLAISRCLSVELDPEGIRVIVVCPWFADTSILDNGFRLLTAGMPMVPVPRVAGAVFLAATDAEPGTQGAVYSIPDDREVFRLPRDEIKEGVYTIFNNRVRRGFGLRHRVNVAVELVKLAVSAPVVQLALAGGIGYVAWQQTLTRGLL